MLKEIKVNDTVLPEEEMKAIREVSRLLMTFSTQAAMNVATSVLGAMLFTKVACGCPNCTDDKNTEIIEGYLDDIRSGILSVLPNTLKIKNEKWLEDNINNSDTKH